MNETPRAQAPAQRELQSIYTTRRITHAEAKEIAQRLINSHFHQEPHARIGIPARPDYDDDLLMTAYIQQQEAIAGEPDEAVMERVKQELWRDLCEKDDRTSPEEYPEMALVSEDELYALFDLYRAAIAALPPAPDRDAVIEALREAVEVVGIPRDPNTGDERPDWLAPVWKRAYAALKSSPAQAAPGSFTPMGEQDDSRLYAELATPNHTQAEASDLERAVDFLWPHYSDGRTPKLKFAENSTECRELATRLGTVRREAHSAGWDAAVEALRKMSRQESWALAQGLYVEAWTKAALDYRPQDVENVRDHLARAAEHEASAVADYLAARKPSPAAEGE